MQKITENVKNRQKCKNINEKAKNAKNHQTLRDMHEEEGYKYCRKRTNTEKRRMHSQTADKVYVVGDI